MSLFVLGIMPWNLEDSDGKNIATRADAFKVKGNVAEVQDFNLFTEEVAVFSFHFVARLSESRWMIYLRSSVPSVWFQR